MTQTKPRHKGILRSAIRGTLTNAVAHRVGKSAAALTYYLLFAIFPLLVFISNLLGMLDLNINAAINALRPVIPSDVVSLLESYLIHVTNNSSPVLFWFSLVFSVWFPVRAVHGLMEDVRLAYHLEKSGKPVAYAIRQFLFTILFLLIIVLLLLLAVFGRRFLLAVTKWLGVDELLQIPAILLQIWQYVRFVLLAVIMLAALSLLYATAQDTKQPVKKIMPGAVAALAAWLIVSIGFSVYVENFSNYSLIYGTLGAVIVLLLWLYMTSLLLILGAEFNAALAQTKANIE